MKNLYYVFLLIFFFNKGYSQNDLQNANWIFGNLAWLDFNNNTLISQTAPPYSQNVTSLTPQPFYNNFEGCASVSDEDGRLLFFTDGERVYRVVNDEIIILDYSSTNDELMGNNSSVQNTIIVPRPNHNERYYLISIAGYTSNQTGLYWSELDISTNQFISRNNLIMDDQANIFDNQFDNRSEAITSCIAANGVDIWMVTHVNNFNYSRILSYLITQDGINVFPSNSFNLPLPTSWRSHSIKISPDTQSLALTGKQSNPLIGTFNNANGSITMNLTPIGDNVNSNFKSTYGVEFSPDSNMLYFSRYSDNSPPNTLGGIFAVNLNNPSLESLVLSTGINTFVIRSLQRGLDNSLYCVRNLQNIITEISNPNSTEAWNVNSITLNQTSRAGLPQWIWSTCKSTSTLISPQDDVDNYISRRERSEWINASNIISNNVNTSAIYHAGNFVELNVGFEGVFGSKFSGYIEGCSNNFQYRQASSSSSTNFSNKKKSNLLLYPNPTNDKVEIKLNNQMFEKVSIATIDGKMMFESDIEKTDKFILDVSRFAQGIYIINVVSENGEIQSQKLIKK